ncbi:hypothetical protein EV201_3111 [Ancylomarina subtilis]|uniref:Uncharacterized protein n=1 Tax=Ancylomarina subtilis TaxID=1639035 RepID=A0A4Q7V6V7_9BACT|nr:hypothetical protein [Ancylomarina subtilis]RZT91297.1 hypothetical protein EV201_3111 [Ancylomarina subtilis]
MTWPVWKVIHGKWGSTEETLKKDLQKGGFTIQKRFLISKDSSEKFGIQAEIWILDSHDYIQYSIDAFYNDLGIWKLKIIQLRNDLIIIEADKSDASIFINMNPNQKDLHKIIDEKLIKIVLKV